jgi:putative transposase
MGCGTVAPSAIGARHIWARGYWVASSGNVTDGVWMECIKNQAAPEPGDNFKVT